MRGKILAMLLAAGVGLPATMARAADDMARVLAEMQRLAARVTALETRNSELEKALASERISEKDPELATRVKYVESQLDAIKGPATKLGEALDGVEVAASITAVSQKVGAGGTASGKSEARGNYRGDLNITLPIGSMGDSDGRFFTHVRFGQGTGVGLRPTYSSGPNTTAFETGAGPDDSFAILAQAWYQLSIPLAHGGRKEDAREHLHLTIGKIDPFVFFDQNAIADDETTKFLNNAFVHNPLLDSGGDIGADQYGFQPGFIAKYENSREKGQEWAVSLGAFASHTGANFSGSFGDPFVIGQIETNVPINFLPGTYRAYAWSNGRAQNYDARQRRNSGWGLSANQKLLDDLSFFARYGHHTAGKVAFDSALTLGTELDGTRWHRSADSLGIAHGRLETSASYRTDSLATAGYRATGSERQTELYYRYQLNGNVELTPNLQWIGNPGGDEGAATVKVAGLRAKIGF